VKGQQIMLRTTCVVCICLAALSAVCESGAKYEVGTIIAVTSHPSATDDPLSGVATYEVSVKVADTIYMVLYTDTLGTKAVRYAGGQELMVHVGKGTITYNDILGQSYDVPIIGRKTATHAAPSQ
jgi:hypothetical protein